MSQPRRRPNFLLLLVDEQRYPPCYESRAILDFRRTQLPTQELLRSQGIEWHRHYVASTACAPSRASLFTGHYPSFHGVTQTDGAAKASEDPRMHWLAPNGVPTMGHLFRAAGYRTLYHGKWHVSHVDLMDAAGRALASTDKRGEPLPDNVAAYQAAEPLEPFGFSGWIGPEPHGAEPGNSGLRRDPFFADQAIASLDALEEEGRRGDVPPWLMVCSLVNPHDIVLFGLAWLRVRALFKDATVPLVEPAPTRREDLSTKPGCQASFVKTYPRMLAPQPTIGLYRQFYYYLHKVVDLELRRVYERLLSSRFFEDTIVIFTSDHGELLGAHGGLHQKWHNAYEEAIRVPLIFAGPPLGTAPRHVNRLSSHVDLLPTMLALAGADAERALGVVSRQHQFAHALPGRDLSALLCEPAASLPDEAVYFMTEDEVSEGTRTLGAFGWQFEPVAQPNHVEAVVARVEGRLWKYARYSGGGPGVAEEHELYDLEADPMEAVNLAHGSIASASIAHIRARLDAALEVERRCKRLVAPQGRVPIADEKAAGVPGPISVRER